MVIGAYNAETLHLQGIALNHVQGLKIMKLKVMITAALTGSQPSSAVKGSAVRTKGSVIR